MIIITSNYTIQQCFPNIEDRLAIQRRFRSVTAQEANEILGGKNPHIQPGDGLGTRSDTR